MLAVCILHTILFFFSLAVVGFNSMILNLAMSCWTYSIYLTVRERATVFYLLILTIGVIEGIMSLLFNTLGNLQFLGKMINVVIYCVIIYLVGKNYFLFRKQGGLHGKQMKEQLLEERILEKAKKGVKKVAELSGDVAGKVEAKVEQKL